MKIIAVSDTHNCHKGLVVPDGDAFVHAGDATTHGTKEEIVDFLTWMTALPHRLKIFVPGNHERKCFYEHTELMRDNPYVAEFSQIRFLLNDRCEIDGISIYGCASMRLSKLNPLRYGEAIEGGSVQLLITHNGPKGTLDQIVQPFAAGTGFANIGDDEIAVWVEKNPPQIHLFGHCHQQGGRVCRGDKTRFYNLAACNDENQLVRQCVEIQIEPNQTQKL